VTKQNVVPAKLAASFLAGQVTGGAGGVVDAFLDGAAAGGDFREFAFGFQSRVWLLVLVRSPVLPVRDWSMERMLPASS
jgi:hypothetical protein